MKEAIKNNLERHLKTDPSLDQYPKAFAQRLRNGALLLAGSSARLRVWELEEREGEIFPRFEITTNGLPFRSSVQTFKKRHFEVWLTGTPTARVARKVGHTLGKRRETPIVVLEPFFTPPKPNKAYFEQVENRFNLVSLN